MGKVKDDLALVLEYCRGTVVDDAWFRQATTLTNDPENRAHTIDYSLDWWYLDESAQYFMEKEGQSDLFRANEGGRIFVPQPEGDGKDILEWLRDRCAVSSV